MSYYLGVHKHRIIALATSPWCPYKRVRCNSKNTCMERLLLVRNSYHEGCVIKNLNLKIELGNNHSTLLHNRPYWFWYQRLSNHFLIRTALIAIIANNLYSIKISTFKQEKQIKFYNKKMPTHLTLDHPDTKSLWEKSVKYSLNLESSHLTDTSSLKVHIFESGLLEQLCALHKRYHQLAPKHS